jgi:hypothetical protein
MTSIYAFCVIVKIKYNCVPDRIRDAGSQFAWVSSREAFGKRGEFLLVSVGILKGKLFGVRDEFAMIELGFDEVHGRGEAVVAVVAFGVASFRFAATGEATIGSAVLLR